MVVSDEMNLTNYKKWSKAIESELKSTRAATGSDVAVDRSVLNIPQKVTSTRWVFKEKYDRSSKARQAITFNNDVIATMRVSYYTQCIAA